MNQTKEQAIQEVNKIDDTERAIYVISTLRDFRCEFCGDKPYKKVFSDVSLGTDLCGYHNQLVDKFRDVGLSNADLREHMASLELLFKRR